MKQQFQEIIEKTLTVKQAAIRNTKHHFTEVVVMVVVSNGKDFMERGLLDKGCSKLIVLKEFVDKKQQTKLEEKDQFTRNIYGGQFKFLLMVSVGF